MLKSLLKSSLVQSFLSWLIYFYIKFVFHTARWTVEGFAPLQECMREGKPALFLFWHGRLAMIPNFSHRAERIHAIVSRHGDGEVIARALQHFGLQLVRGSTDRAEDVGNNKERGGRAALRDALRLLHAGHILAVTPDGPRGPRMHLRRTVAALASKTGAPVFTLTFSTQSAHCFSTWDRFLLPFPFTRGVFLCSGPYYVPESATAEELENSGKAIENQLNSITQEADRRCGRNPVLPA